MNPRSHNCRVGLTLSAGDLYRRQLATSFLKVTVALMPKQSLTLICSLALALTPSLGRAQTYCDSRRCSFPDHLGDIQVMMNFVSRAGIPIRQISCRTGLLGVFTASPPRTGTMTICNAALLRGVYGVRETFQHEMVHAAQFCKAKNNGLRGFLTISNDYTSIFRHSKSVGVFRHAGGVYGHPEEHEAYTLESARPRDVLYYFNAFCIEGKKELGT